MTGLFIDVDEYIEYPEEIAVSVAISTLIEEEYVYYASKMDRDKSRCVGAQMSEATGVVSR